MPWEARRNGLRYYYRRGHRHGQLTWEYLGRGPHAEQAAAEDAARRQQRQAQVQERHQEQQDWQAHDALLQQLDQITQLLTRGTLYVAGYHRHARSTWRRRHHDPETQRPEPSGTS